MGAINNRFRRGMLALLFMLGVKDRECMGHQRFSTTASVLSAYMHALLQSEPFH